MDWRHNRPIRIALLTLSVLIAIVAFAPYFVSLDLVRQTLSERIAQDTGRTLNIKGNARLVLFPHPAVLLDDVSLSEPNSTTLFATAQEAQIELGFWPLITQRKLLVHDIAFATPTIHILRREDGSLNFEDLLAQGRGDKRLNFAVEGLHLNAAELHFADAVLGTEVVISKMDLNLSNLADPRNGALSAQGSVAIGSHSKANADWQGQINASASMRYKADERRLLVGNLKLDLRQIGDSSPELQISNTNLSATGNLVYGWHPLRFNGGELKLSGSMLRATQQWQLDLDLPEIDLHDASLALNKLKLAASMKSPNGNFTTAITIPSLTGQQHASLKTQQANIDVKIHSPDQDIQLAFTSPLELRQDAQVYLSAYQLQGKYSNRNLPRGAIPFKLQGDGILDPRSETFALSSQGTLDNEALKTSLRINDFLTPRYDLQLDLARLDLSPYLPAVAANAKEIDQDATFDLWWLERLNATGSARIGELILQKMHINDLVFTLAAKDKKLQLNPLSATIYEGKLKGSAELDTSGEKPAIRIQQQLSNMNINPLLADALNLTRFEGRGFITVDLHGSGKSMTGLRNTASGKVTMQLRKGAMRGIDIQAVLRTAANQIRLMNGDSTPAPSNLSQRTDFSELNASIMLRDGVAYNKDLRANAGVIKLQGSGTLDLGVGDMNYTVLASTNPKVPELSDLRGLSLPIQFTGLISAPDYKVDYASIKTQLLAKQQKTTKAKSSPAARRKK